MKESNAKVQTAESQKCIAESQLERVSLKLKELETSYGELQKKVIDLTSKMNAYKKRGDSLASSLKRKLSHVATPETIAALKEENIILKESLEKARANKTILSKDTIGVVAEVGTKSLSTLTSMIGNAGQVSKELRVRNVELQRLSNTLMDTIADRDLALSQSKIVAKALASRIQELEIIVESFTSVDSMSDVGSTSSKGESSG